MCYIARGASLGLANQRAPSSASEDRDMNHYAAEQLARQRHDQFAREAYGDTLVRLARSAAPHPSQPSVGPLPLRRVASRMWRRRGVMLAGISRWMSQRHGAEESRTGERPTHPGIV